MPDTAPHPAPPAPPAAPAVRPGPMLSVGLLVGWTLFVWLGRVRNAYSDPTLGSSGRTGALLLALSFVVPALVVGVLAVLSRPSRGSDGDPARSWLRAGVLLLAAWTTVVWVVKVADIALGGDHPAGFVAVHAVLGIVSIVLAGLAVRAAGGPVPTRTGRVPSATGRS